MNTRRWFSLGLILGLLIVGCAGAGIQYRFYGVVPSRGLLLGSGGEDLPLSVCEPDFFVHGKCVVLFASEFERILIDLAYKSERLKACEEGHLN